MVVVRQRVRAWATEMKFSLVEQTKIVTAASELGRNTLEHGGGGSLELALVSNGARRGIRLRFSDKGPGIRMSPLALKDGFTTGAGMGLGLGGSKRLMNEFEIETKAGRRHDRNRHPMEVMASSSRVIPSARRMPARAGNARRQALFAGRCDGVR